ncbi:MAG TPA: glycosyltransferase [Tenuifilaceae bacterium]|nr:glycosyltransferase [Tenuifilaceae bacterium]HPN22421.1 glycosyltransferase [Tenuifilaceae bacterium]
MLSIFKHFVVEEIIRNSKPYELIIAGVLLVSLLIQLYYYLGIYLRVALFKKTNDNPSINTEKPPVSVVICARNEEENLKHFLPKVLEQNYPNYEVIVVNDCSADNSDIVLENFQKQYPHLKVTTIKEDEKFSHTKKLALTVGIKAAKNEWLLLTDADCIPQSDLWLATMAENFKGNTEVVLGYGGYLSEKGLLNKLIRFDTLLIAMNYLGLTLIGKPYMGVGRNLAYKRSLFFKNRGFASHSQIDSGDDDLFIREVANKTNTVVEFRHEAHTLSVPRKTYSNWIRQKRRHTSTSKYYSSGIKLLLGLEPFSRLLFFLSATVLIALLYFPYVVGSMVIVRMIVKLSIIKAVMKKLNEKKILLTSLLWDFYSLYFYSKLLLLNSVTSKKTKWR